MKRTNPLILFILPIVTAVAAATETDLSGRDAEFLMNSIKGGRNIPSGNPNPGVATSMTFEVRRGGFDLSCKATGLIFIRTNCKLKLDPSVSDANVSIVEESGKLVVIFSDPEFVQGLKAGLVQNPWRSETRARDGSELLNLFCETSLDKLEKFCRLTLGN